MVDVTKEMAEPVHGEAFKLVVQMGAACVPAGGLHGDHDIAEKYAIAGWIGFTRQFLHVKAQHVGGAIEATELAIERADFVIAGEHQGGR